MVNVLKQLDLPKGIDARLVHQSLHGYSDGHRLIESSIDCPADVARLMLRMSDLSGGNVVPGFDDYLTAFPLKQIGMYAFAKTWLAPEMPRPGCVWTHTLMFSEFQLDFLSLESFLRLFRRPQFRKDSGLYIKPMVIEAQDESPASNENCSERLAEAKRVLAAFYKPSSPAVILPSKSSLEHQSLVLALWSQQWPNLRATTTFSTGSLSSRSFDGRPFDIQCVPISVVREAQREISSTAGSEVLISDNVSMLMPDWVDEAAKDLLGVRGLGFRDFLWDVGSSESVRPAFERFARIYHELNQTGSGNIVEILGQNFPQASQGSALKIKMLGGEESLRPAGPDEAELLTSLGTTEYFSAFDAAALRLGERGAKLGNTPEQAKRLVGNLFKTTINPLGAEVLAGLISGLDARAARHLTFEHPHLLSTIVAAKPSLAASPQLWLGAENSKWEVFDCVAKCKNLDDSVVNGVVYALLESKCDDLFRRAIDVWGRKAIFSAMDWQNRSENYLSEHSRGSLTFHTKQVMDWVEDGTGKSTKGLLGAAHILAPYAYQVRDRNTKVWESLKKELDGYERVYLSSFLLALGLSNAPEHPVEQIKEHFTLIYQLAWDEKLDSKTWEILEPIVPEISWPNNWDRCERMVRGLIASFIRYQWPPQQIYSCVSKNSISERFPKSAKKVEGGIAFMGKLL